MAPDWPSAALIAALLLAAALGCGAPDGTPSEPQPATGTAHGEPAPGAAAQATGGGDQGRPARSTAEIEKLADNLADSDWNVRDRAARELVKIGAPAVSCLVSRLDPQNLVQCTEALFCLEHIGAGGRAEVEDLLGRARDFDVIVFCLRALGSIGDASSVGKIKPFLGWTSKPRPENADYYELKMDDCRQGKIRNQAAESMARLGDTSAMPVLIAALRGNGWVRRDAIVSLRRLTDCELDFGFVLDDPEVEREKAVAKWENWWKENAATFKPKFAMSLKVMDIYSLAGK